MTIGERLKEFVFMMTHTPNSPKGLRHRAARLVKAGLAMQHPSVSLLVKQALFKENKENLIPDPDVWEHMSGKAKSEWVRHHLEGGD